VGKKKTPPPKKKKKNNQGGGCESQVGGRMQGRSDAKTPPQKAVLGCCGRPKREGEKGGPKGGRGSLGEEWGVRDAAGTARPQGCFGSYREARVGSDQGSNTKESRKGSAKKILTPRMGADDL